jgi:hypothetical protein
MNGNAADSFGVTRRGLEITTHAEAERVDREFWWSRTAIERLRHLEALRELNYGPEVINQRLQRILTVLKRPRR